MRVNIGRNNALPFQVSRLSVSNLFSLFYATMLCFLHSCVNVTVCKIFSGWAFWYPQKTFSRCCFHLRWREQTRRKLSWRLKNALTRANLRNVSQCYVSVKSKLQHPPFPRAYPGHLTPLPSRGGGNLIIRDFQGVGVGFPLGVGNMNCTLNFMWNLWRGELSWGTWCWRIFVEKIVLLWPIGYKARA